MKRSLSARRPALLLLALLLLPAGEATAQRLYRVEVSGAATYGAFDKATELAGSAGGALRLGYWMTQRFAFEVIGGIAVPKSRNGMTVDVRTAGLALLANFPVSLHSSFYLKGGYASVTYGQGTCPAVSVVGDGPCGNAGSLLAGAGLRIALSPTLMIRTEALVDHSTSPSFNNVQLSTGLSLMLGSSRLTDNDHDLVYDRFDHCPNTPAGAIVDKHGCPSDFDKDGVLDGLDRCPNTPAGAAVNEVGCPRDTDRDGVLDGLDKCEDTPIGAVIDANGCPRDSDGDGVFDGLDRCPETPAGATVDQLGCPGDKDNDRVPDGIDRCPDTPPGTPVNSFGCPPNQDSDRDGVYDSLDRCPGTPRGTPVDLNGCPRTPADTTRPAARDTTVPPRAASAPAGDTAWVVPGTAFDLRSAVLKPEVRPLLDSIAVALIARPGLRVEIAGNAHDQVAPAQNQRLSRERAQVVRDYLLRRGVPDGQMLVRWFGANNLLTNETSPEARARNRRVEIRPAENRPD